MATFLVNARMDPALAARIDASVNGGRRVRGRPRPGITAVIRVIFFVAIALFVWAVATVKKPPLQPRTKSPAPVLSITPK